MAEFPTLRLELALPLPVSSTARPQTRLNTAGKGLNTSYLNRTKGALPLRLNTAGQGLNVNRWLVPASVPGWSWVDVTAELEGSIAIKRGRSSELESFQAGTMSCTLANRSGDFDPWNTLGKYYAAGGVSLIRPLVPVRLTCLWSGTWWPLFRGWVENWPPSFEDPGWSEVQLQCTDGFGMLGRYDANASGSAGTGETASSRISRVLDRVGWPTADRDISPTATVTLQATDGSMNALAELQLVTATEGGAVWCGPDGRIVFRSRRDLYGSSSARLVQCTIGDQTGDVMFDAPPTWLHDLSQYWNRVQYSRVGGATTTLIDQAAHDTYGGLWLSKTRTDLIAQNDNDVDQLARLHLSMYRRPQQRPQSVRVNCGARRSTFAQILPLEFRHRVRIRKRHPAGHNLDRECWVESINHTIGPGPLWVTDLGVSDAQRYKVCRTNTAGRGLNAGAVLMW